jgi:hypothetical protein
MKDERFASNAEVPVSEEDSGRRVLTNLAKWNSLSFPGFPDTISSDIQTIPKCKLHQTIHAK